MILKKKKPQAAKTAKPAAAKPTNTKAKKAKKGRIKGSSFAFRFFKLVFTVIIVAGILVCGGVAAYVWSITRSLPQILTLKDYKPPIITKIYDDKGDVIGEFFKEKRILTPIEDIPETLSHAFVSAEDGRFYEHSGVDPISIARAIYINQTTDRTTGGSTITQQVVKSLLLTPERTYKRKIKEAVLAYRLEKNFTKDEILYFYLNQIYLGHSSHGVEAAAQNYFGKTVTELNLAECAMLAGLPQAPSNYSPFTAFSKAKARQSYVLNQMVKDGYITPQQAEDAKNAEVIILPRQENAYTEKVPFYTEYVRRYIEEKYGENMLYKEGLQIYTAVNVEMQLAAEEAIKTELLALDSRHTFRGPLYNLKTETDYKDMMERIEKAVKNSPLTTNRIIKAIVVFADDNAKTVTVQIGPNNRGLLDLKGVKWDQTLLKNPSKEFQKNDVIMVQVLGEKENGVWPVTLYRYSAVQGALLCMENGTGLVKALVGGRDFADSQFNRAIQSRRQPGSSFKPILYAAALDYVNPRGKQPYVPSSILLDSAIVVENTGAGGATWKPKNYEGRGTFYGMIPMREALAKSRNLVSIRIIMDITPSYTVEYARKLGITSNLDPYPSLALGSSGLSLMEMTHAYSIFANGGKDLTPIFVITIIDRDGNILEDNQNLNPPQAIDPATAFMMTSMLSSVVREGTAARAKALNRPAAGKTGTTNSGMDAWFLGYTAQYITGVWIGFDELKPLGYGETGSRPPLSVWIDYMKVIHEGLPAMEFKASADIAFARVDASTGLLPIPESKKVVLECFRKGQVPKQYSKRPGDVETDEDFFKNMF